MRIYEIKFFDIAVHEIILNLPVLEAKPVEILLDDNKEHQTGLSIKFQDKIFKENDIFSVEKELVQPSNYLQKGFSH